MSVNSLERKLRRDLSKQGYRLCKSRARNWSLDNQLGYMIIMDGCVVLGSRFDLTLEDVQDFVKQ